MWQEEAGDRIVREFPQLVQAAVADQLRQLQESMPQLFQQHFSTAMSQWESGQSERQFLEQQKNEFFQVDQAGQILVNPQTGDPALTPKGEAFRQYCVEGRELGISNDANIRRYAEQRLSADVAAGKFGQANGASGNTAGGQGQASGGGASQLMPDQIAAQKKGEFMRQVVKGQRQPNRGGTIPDANSQRLQNPSANLHSILDEEMERHGIKPQTG
jgi:hypothetical protein